MKEIIKKISFSNASQHTHISSVQAVKPSLLFNFCSDDGGPNCRGVFYRRWVRVVPRAACSPSPFFVSRSSSQSESCPSLSRHKSLISLAKNGMGNDQYAVHNEELFIRLGSLPVFSTHTGLYRSQTHFSTYKLKEMSYFSLCKPPKMGQFNPSTHTGSKSGLRFLCLLHTALGDKRQIFLRF